MKGNSKVKQTTVLLIAYVLVVGFVGAGGQVYGQDSSDTSGITVTVEEEEATITLDGLWEGDDDTGDRVDIGSGPEDDFTPGESMFIRATVSTDSGSDYIESVSVDLTYEGLNADGDAVVDYLGITLSNVDADWDSSGTYEGTEDTDNMIRYADPSDTTDELWQAEAEVVTEGTVDDTSTMEFNVESYSTIITSGSISGTGTPGDTLSSDPGTDESAWSSEDSIDTFEANFEWSINAPEPTIEDTDGNQLTGFTTNYDNPSGIPTTTVTDDGTDTAGPGADPHYELTIDLGSPPGDYTGDLSHEVSISE